MSLKSIFIYPLQIEINTAINRGVNSKQSMTIAVLSTFLY